jgi:nucleoside-diphosphate-sugar epimerase
MILVTGGTGFLGAHLLQILCENEQEITAIKQEKSNLEFVKKVFERYSSNPENFSKIKWVNASVNDIFSLDDVMAGIHHVYHCAGFVSFQKKDKDKLFEINEKGTENVVNAAIHAGVKKLIHVSSIAALGRADVSEPIHENTRWKNSPSNSNYAVSKYSGEKQVWRGIEEGLNAVIVNPGMIFGYDLWDKGTSALFKKIANGLKFYSGGSNGMVDVRDVANAMILLMNSEIVNERFILVSENLTFKTLTLEICKALGIAPAKYELPAMVLQIAAAIESIKSKLSGKPALITGETIRNASTKSIYDNKKLIQMTGFRYKPMKETLEEMAKIYRIENQ